MSSSLPEKLKLEIRGDHPIDKPRLEKTLKDLAKIGSPALVEAIKRQTAQIGIDPMADIWVD